MHLLVCSYLETEIYNSDETKNIYLKKAKQLWFSIFITILPDYPIYYLDQLDTS
jgi:hypothetical protein